jgi:hypothetical protein
MWNPKLKATAHSISPPAVFLERSPFLIVFGVPKTEQMMVFTSKMDGLTSKVDGFTDTMDGFTPTI